MKVYISADIEGINGTTDWDECDKKHADYEEFRKQMTAEVAASCEAALQAGAREILVKDAHDSARNIIAASLPREARLLRGWSGHPYMMMDGLDNNFSAALMVGYHSRSGSAGSPLAHTMTGSNAYIKINEQFASEFMINAYTAGLAGVPLVFLSGDAALCQEARQFIPCITTVAVKEGRGASTTNLHPQAAIDQIHAGVLEALSGDIASCLVRLPDHFAVEILYKDHKRAYSNSFYPGASLCDPFTLVYESTDFMDVLRLIAFVV